MADANETTKPAPLPTDGWASRKLIVGVGTLVALAGVASVALFSGFADFTQWAGFLQWLVPGVLVPLFGALGIDKLAEAKRVGP